MVIATRCQYETQLQNISERCRDCKHQKGNLDSYACPSFVDSINNLLSVGDIPIHSTPLDTRLLRRDPKEAPWNDSIKTLILDIASFDRAEPFDVIILLCASGYEFARTASRVLCSRNIVSSGSVVEVVPNDDDEKLFTVSVFVGTVLEYSWTIEGENVPSVLSAWSSYSNRAVICHDITIPAYRNAMHILEGGAWSVTCTLATFVYSSSTGSTVQYVCPIFGCDGSTETRAVGSKDIQIADNPASKNYEGALGFYNRSIKGSVHSSGRCYDCEMAYRIIGNIIQQTVSTIALGDVVFVNLDSRQSS